MGGCGVLGGQSADEVSVAFLDALAAGRTAEAASLTDSPQSARSLLSEVRGRLDPREVTARLVRVNATPGTSQASTEFALSWDLGSGRVWRYRGSAELYTVDDGWKVHWQPSVLHPKLASEQSVAVYEQEPELAPVLDRDGRELIAPQRVVSVLLDPRRTPDLRAVAGELATALHQFDPEITRKAIIDGAAEQQRGSSYLVAALRDADYQQVKPRIYELPGVRFSETTRLLPVDKKLDARVLAEIRQTVRDDVAGRSGWRVSTVSASGTEIEQLYSRPARHADAVHVALGLDAQSAAESALSKLDKPAAMVAIQPSSGELLAVAQNEAATEQGHNPLTGRYPPGSTFKVVTAAAALSSGEYTEDTPVDCPGTTVIGHRQVPNNERFDLGTVPLHTALAKSCNTTFAKISSGLPADALHRAGKRFGFGVDFVMPGATTVTGSVPVTESVEQRAVNGFGQGTVLASPFGMALTAATVASGQLPTPSLLRQGRTKVNTRVEPLPVRALVPLRHMMREVVTVGTAGVLADVPGVRGKTGTAQYGDGSKAHGWFIGYRGDVAFAVLVVGGGTALPAVKAAGRFLRDNR